MNATTSAAAKGKSKTSAKSEPLHMVEPEAQEEAKSPLEQFTENMLMFGQQYQKLMHAYMEAGQRTDPASGLSSQLHIGAAFMRLYSQMMSEPEKMLEAQIGWADDYMKLLQHSASRLLGEESQPVISPDKKDKRFKDAAWQEHPAFDFIKQFYLLSAKRMEESVRQTEGLDASTAHKVSFYTQQFIDALSPTNYLFTNPEVLRTTLETQGENLVKGMENLIKDVSSGRISMTDVEAFKVGENIAATPGKVVYRNDLMELIQYEPATETVYRKPLLMIPAWINKYYILDLKPENSLVKWLVGQGYTVFMVSWVNPSEAHSDKTFEDYLKQGPLAALGAIEELTGEKEICGVGYCLGGTLLSITQAYLAAKGEKRFASATYYTTMTDFSEAGDLSVFIDEEQLETLESRMSAKGYLEGKEMAQTFNLLRANDLIWYFVVNNYLLGKSPFPFDLLYWNSDATRMPAQMHSFYLRSMYQKNLLAKPGGITVLNTPIDLTKVKTPSYMLSTKEDHIAPWHSTYKGTQLFKGPVTFVLADSGHVAGVINPPAKQKYSYWTAGVDHPKSPEDWFKEAQEKPGSWWPHWVEWNKTYAGEQIAARKPKKALADAPGEYVKARV